MDVGGAFRLGDAKSVVAQHFSLENVRSRPLAPPSCSDDTNLRRGRGRRATKVRRPRMVPADRASVIPVAPGDTTGSIVAVDAERAARA